MLTIAEKPGAIPVAQIRECFEQAIRETKALADNTPLGTMEINGVFSHYMDPDTDTMWLGFALGMRYHERMLKAGELKVGGVQ